MSETMMTGGPVRISSKSKDVLVILSAFLGTFGAFIRMRTPTNRTALFDADSRLRRTERNRCAPSLATISRMVDDDAPSALLAAGEIQAITKRAAGRVGGESG